MKEKILPLIQLQDCDNKIREITDKKNKAPLKIQALEEKINTLDLEIHEGQEKLDSYIKKRRTFEQEIVEIDSKIEKSNTKLASIKSNKEYRAALKEIEDLKKAKNASEESILQLMENIEEQEKICNEDKNKRIELNTLFEKDRKKIEKTIRALQRELKKVEKQGSEYIKNSDPELLKRYNFLKERKMGLAIGPVISGVCQCCHMKLPPQKYNELLKGNNLLSCPNCNRMIYWPDDDFFQKAMNNDQVSKQT